MRSMRVGDAVSHPDYGRGTILELEQRGSEWFAVVKFVFAKKALPFEQLVVEGAREGGAAPEVFAPVDGDEVSVEPLSAASKAARAGILALKLGQVLETHVSDLTVGTTKDETELEGVFNTAKQRKGVCFVLVEGVWGAGKTHLLTLMSAMANRHQFAVSTTILDGTSASFSRPNDLLASVTSNIRFPGEAAPTGIGHRLPAVKLTGMPDLEGMGADRVLRALLEVPIEALHNPDVVEVLECYLDLSLPASHAKSQLKNLGCGDVALPAMRARNVEHRAPRLAELLGDWTAFCVACKSKGLLVVFDEVDVDYARASRWNYETRSRHDAMLKALSDLRRLKIPLVIAFGSAPAGDDAEDQNDAAKDVFQKLRPVDLHLLAQRLERQDLESLSQKLWSLYAKAYPGFEHRLSEAQLRKIQKSLATRYFRQLAPVPRRYVRALLHCFDVADLGVPVSELIDARPEL